MRYLDFARKQPPLVEPLCTCLVMPEFSIDSNVYHMKCLNVIVEIADIVMTSQ